MFSYTSSVIDKFSISTDIQAIVSRHVESIVLLLKLHTKQNIEVELEMSEFDAKQPNCTGEKENAIKDALKHFQTI